MRYIGWGWGEGGGVVGLLGIMDVEGGMGGIDTALERQIFIMLRGTTLRHLGKIM